MTNKVYIEYTQAKDKFVLLPLDGGGQVIAGPFNQKKGAILHALRSKLDVYTGENSLVTQEELDALKPKKRQNSDVEHTAFKAICLINEVCQFMSNEKKGEKVTNSELRRWFESGSIEVNYQPIKADDPWPPFIKSLILFPKSVNKRSTIIFNSDVTLISITE